MAVELGLTPGQRKVYDAIKAITAMNEGTGASLDDVRVALDSSTVAIREHLRALMRAGAIRKDPARWRPR